MEARRQAGVGARIERQVRAVQILDRRAELHAGGGTQQEPGADPVAHPRGAAREERVAGIDQVEVVVAEVDRVGAQAESQPRGRRPTVARSDPRAAQRAGREVAGAQGPTAHGVGEGVGHEPGRQGEVGGADAEVALAHAELEILAAERRQRRVESDGAHLVDVDRQRRRQLLGWRTRARESAERGDDRGLCSAAHRATVIWPLRRCPPESWKR